MLLQDLKHFVKSSKMRVEACFVGLLVCMTLVIILP